nr:hypothetical protein [Candidatus Kapabacteria bacterium]
KIDFFNNIILDTIVIQDININIRSLAVDATNQNIWVCDINSDLYLVDIASGEIIDTIQIPSLNNKIGIGIYSSSIICIMDTTNGIKVYLFNRFINQVVDYFDISNDFGLQNISVSSFGSSLIMFGGKLFGILHQGDEDFFFLYEYDILPLFNLYSPPNLSNYVTITPFFNWRDQENNSYYTLQISTDEEFNNLIISATNLTISEYTLPDSNQLNYQSTYYWRVGGFNLYNELEWTSSWSFTTEPTPPSNIEIPLSLGWNLISSNVIPTEPAMENVFEGMNNIVLVKNGAGQIYSPAFGINQIGDWNVEAGYYVYTNGSSILNISGAEVIPSQQGIELNAGWNLISYLRSTPMNAQQALAGISSNLIMAKNNLGGFYHPGFGINTLGNMQPGQGYWLYITAPAVLYYPGN